MVAAAVLYSMSMYCSFISILLHLILLPSILQPSILQPYILLYLKYPTLHSSALHSYPGLCTAPPPPPGGPPSSCLPSEGQSPSRSTCAIFCDCNRVIYPRYPRYQAPVTRYIIRHQVHYQAPGTLPGTLSPVQHSPRLRQPQPDKPLHEHILPAVPRVVHNLEDKTNFVWRK